MVYSELPENREQARKTGSVSYFTGKPCGRGHVDKRYTNTGLCYGCKRLQMQRDYKSHAQRIKDANTKSNKKYWQRVLAQSRTWAAKNRIKSRQIKKAWKLRNKEYVAAYWKRHNREKRKTDPLWRLNRNTSKAIWESLKKAKNGRPWEALVEFTLEQLVQRLEHQFRPGMSWENYGKIWEIDHVKPLSLCASFEEAWKLTNLQPLECSKNRSKCNRYIG